MALRITTLTFLFFNTLLVASCFESRRKSSERTCEDYKSLACEIDPVGKWRATDFCVDRELSSAFSGVTGVSECENLLNNFDVDITGFLELTPAGEMKAELSISLFAEFSISDACAVALGKPSLPREFCSSEKPSIRVEPQNAYLGEPNITDNQSDCDLSDTGCTCAIHIAADIHNADREYSIIDNKIYYADGDGESAFCVADDILLLGEATRGAERDNEIDLGSSFLVFTREW